MSQNQNQGDYDFDTVPPNFDLCEIHGRAKKVYAEILESEKDLKREICRCCANPLDLPQIPLCCGYTDLYHLGAGFPMYFQYVNFAKILLFIMIPVAVYNIYTNYNANTCDLYGNGSASSSSYGYCTSTYITQISLANKGLYTNQLQITDDLHLAATIVMIIAIYHYNKRARALAEDIDKSQHTPSDFTVVLTNCPREAEDQEIADLFQNNLIPGQEVKVMKITRAYSIGPIIQLNREKTKLLMQRKKMKEDDPALNEQIESLSKQIDALEQNTQDLQRTKYVYVTLERESHAHLAEEILKLGFFSRVILRLGLGCVLGRPKIREVTIIAEKAPEPTDILWENLHASTVDKMRRRLTTTVISTFLIAICFGIIIGISIEKKNIANSISKNNVSTIALSVIIAILLMIINQLLGISTRKFSTYEQHTTYTNFYVSVASRLGFAMFLNTSITIFIVGLILNNLFVPGGLMDSVLMVFIVNAISAPTINLLNPVYFATLLKRSSLLKQGAECRLTQGEANKIWEGPQVDMAQKFANCIKTVWLTAFFAAAFPFGVFISFVGIIYAYWVDKYLILRRYSKPLELGSGLAFKLAEDLEMVPLLYSLGCWIFGDLVVANLSSAYQYNHWTIIGFGISALLWLVPLQSIIKMCRKEDESSHYSIETYTDRRKYFGGNDYGIANPVTHDVEMEDYLNYLNNVDANKAAEMRAKQQQIGFGGGWLNNLRMYAVNNTGLTEDDGNMVLPGRVMSVFRAPKLMMPNMNISYMPQPVMMSQPMMMSQPQFGMQGVYGNQMPQPMQQPMNAPNFGYPGFQASPYNVGGDTNQMQNQYDNQGFNQNQGYYQNQGYQQAFYQGNPNMYGQPGNPNNINQNMPDNYF